jgi:hypothetical protein
MGATPEPTVEAARALLARTGELAAFVLRVANANRDVTRYSRPAQTDRRSNVFNPEIEGWKSQEHDSQPRLPPAPAGPARS